MVDISKLTGGGHHGAGRRNSEVVSAESTPLWRCLQEEDIAGIETLVKKNHCNVNIQDSTFGWTPAHFVCNTGNTKLLKLFLEAKAKVGIGDNEGNTPLMLSCRRGHLKTVEFLIGKMVQLDVKNNNGWTALMWAAINGHEDAATALMGANSSYLATDKEGRSACMWAARHGHLGIVEAILACGINLDIQDHAGLTVMDHAQEHHNMRSMIAAVGELSDELLMAVKRGDKEEVASLLQAGANVELRDEDGWTPLMWAVMQKSVDLVELMVRHGANPSLLDEKGEAIEQLGTAHMAVGEALHTILGSNDRMLTAAKVGDWDAVEEELKAGAFVNIRDDSKRTCLMWAGRNRAPEAMATLVSKNALLDERDLFGWAAVHYAVESRDLETVAMLWYLGANFTLRTSEDDSLLHIAVRGDDGPMIQLLLASQAAIEDLNVEKHTPLMIASTNSLTQSIHTLMAYKASNSATDTFKRTPFALAVVKGQMKAISAMLEPKLPPKLLPEKESSKPAKAKKPAGKAAARSAAPKKSAGPTSPAHESKQAHRKQLAQAASGVAKRKKVAPSVTAEKRGEDPKALLQQALDRRTEIVSAQGKKSSGSLTKTLLRQVDCDHRQPLALSVVNSNMQIFHRLIEEGADISVSNLLGNTVLMEAVIAKQREAVTRLLELGVKADAINKEGKNAKDVCEDPIIRQMLDRYSIVSKLSDSATPVDEIGGDQRKPSKVQRIFRIRMEQLPTALTDELLEEGIRLFLKQRGAATVLRIDVALDPITSRPRGYAYLDFADAASADLAMRGDGMKMNGHVVRMVQEASMSLVSGN
mmetsp:Transcript_93155/g.272630  ORF Transcript_93155/g.272630 Transcript_93155/m.272630 type:complete len:815 (-) Transcript_93155:115-2559(-)